MGGPVPLGYQVIERKLVVVPEEAERVRSIMLRYLEVGTVPALIARLRADGIVTKVQPRTSGPHRGGIHFARGSLFHLLKNPIYRSKIVHKGAVYEGEHEAIVDLGLWEQVQMLLKEKAPPRKRPTNDPQRGLLTGLLSDPSGRQIVPTYATKGTRRYAYYETRKDLARPGDPPATRFTQGALDAHVIGHLGQLLADEHVLRRLAAIAEAEQLRVLFRGATVLAPDLSDQQERYMVIRQFVAALKVTPDQLQLTLKPEACGLNDQPSWIWCIPLPNRKPFREAKLRIDEAGQGPAPDQQLMKLLADACAVQRLVIASPDLSLNMLAAKVGRCRKTLARLLRLSWLSPDLVEAIANGSQPKSLTRARLLEAELPIDWAEQKAFLGFAG